MHYFGQIQSPSILQLACCVLREHAFALANDLLDPRLLFKQLQLRSQKLSDPIMFTALAPSILAGGQSLHA